MAEIVNLRTARKARQRADAAAQAAGNRAKFGRTAAEKARDGAEAARAARLLDGARREREGD
ncbi:DUF4169 family protein [Novosphingobium huizhouense]|uniref:DUF4169 family protein n=1 Tax=Novosphingobium huizhouense TaxID=2866625 RepID=UPI001CD82E84|nr:DUF4169 family protein [Novosphingobium huizhouense]